MRYLVISDIHGNLEALEAVRRDAAGLYDEVLCCGDLVGYGADPNAVVAWVRDHARSVVRGNHDRACVGLEDLEWFNPVARIAAEWTQEQLIEEHAEWIRHLQRGPARVEGFQIAHGSPLDEDEYVVSAIDAEHSFCYCESPLLFFGHTHLQGGFRWRRRRVERIARADGRPAEVLIDDDSAYILNPGSVGQPRDGDWRAGYAIYDTLSRRVTLYRCEYDIAEAQKKIRAAGLPPILADRLRLGK